MSLIITCWLIMLLGNRQESWCVFYAHLSWFETPRAKLQGKLSPMCSWGPRDIMHWLVKQRVHQLWLSKGHWMVGTAWELLWLGHSWSFPTEQPYSCTLTGKPPRLHTHHALHCHSSWRAYPGGRRANPGNLDCSGREPVRGWRWHLAKRIKGK